MGWLTAEWGSLHSSCLLCPFSTCWVSHFHEKRQGLHLSDVNIWSLLSYQTPSVLSYWKVTFPWGAWIQTFVLFKNPGVTLLCNPWNISSYKCSEPETNSAESSGRTRCGSEVYQPLWCFMLASQWSLWLPALPMASSFLVVTFPLMHSDRGNMQQDGCSSVFRRCHLQFTSGRGAAIKAPADSSFSGSRHTRGENRETEGVRKRREKSRQVRARWGGRKGDINEREIKTGKKRSMGEGLKGMKWRCGRVHRRNARMK